MKNLYLFLLLFSFSIYTKSQEINEKEIKTEVKSATVFFNGAQINREKTIELAKGENTLKFINLSPFIDKKSIQIKAIDVEIEGINFKKNFLKSSKKDIVLESLLKKLENTENEIEQKKLFLKINEEEINFLKSNRDLVSEKQNINITNFKDATVFYASKIKLLYTEEYKLKSELRKIESEKEKIDKEINNYTLDKNYGTGEIYVKLNSKKAKSISFEISYNVENVGWYPSYDVRVKNINSPLEIVYKANLKQNSMVDWKDVKLKFSSANPSNSIQIKSVVPYFLNYGTYPPIYEQENEKITGNVSDGENVLPGAMVTVKGTTIGTETDFDGNYEIKIPEGRQTLVFKYLGYKTKEIPANGNPINVILQEDTAVLDEIVVIGYGTTKKKRAKKEKKIEEELQGVTPGITIRGQASLNNFLEVKQVTNQTTFNFDVVKPYSINSSNKDIKIPLQNIDVQAQYQYFAFPKVNKNAFLIAKLDKWEKYNLLEGEANIYFEDTFIGSTLLNTRNSKETLEISLGMDKNVFIDRVKEEVYNTQQFLGSKQEDLRIWNFTIKNNKQENISIEIIDQIPISTNENIKVELDTDVTLGSFDKKTGEVKWKVNVLANKTESFKLKYVVKYPKGTNLVID